MKHLIIGPGNLGTDIAFHLMERGQEVVIASQTETHPVLSIDCAYDFPKRDTKPTINEVIQDIKPDVIWCCVGAGGPTLDPDMMSKQEQLHVLLPLEIMGAAHKDTRIILFSTHYLTNDQDAHLSYYVKTKRLMERMAVNRPKTTVYRVGSLYGNHFPKRGFPGKIIPKLLSGQSLSLPENRITPTPTAWLAEILVMLEIAGVQHDWPIKTIGPSGDWSVVEWGKNIAAAVGVDHKLVTVREADSNYPFNCGIKLKGADPLDSTWANYGFEHCALVKQQWGH